MILVVSPHADDELFGAGGFIMKSVEKGMSVSAVLVACSDIEMHHSHEVISGSERDKEFRKSCAMLGCDNVVDLWMKDSCLDTEPLSKLVSLLDEVVRDLKPDTVLIPERSYHQDHDYVNRACIAALRPTTSWSPSKVLEYEVPTSTWASPQFAFHPNMYCDIGGFIERKKKIFVDCYTSQLSDSRTKLAVGGIDAHALYRGDRDWETN